MSGIEQFEEQRVRKGVGKKLPAHITAFVNGVIDPLFFPGAKLERRISNVILPYLRTTPAK
jgi:hypothetical protein